MFDYNSYLQAMLKLDEKTRNIRFIQAYLDGDLKKIKNILLDNKQLNVNMYFKDSQNADGFR